MSLLNQHTQGAFLTDVEPSRSPESTPSRSDAGSRPDALALRL